jgi:hypothetical protein
MGAPLVRAAGVYSANGNNIRLSSRNSLEPEPRCPLFFFLFLRHNALHRAMCFLAAPYV